MERRGTWRLALLGWVLLHAGRDGAWQQVGEFAGPQMCDRVRESSVANETLHEIGSALADQPADNPIRQQAYGRAARRVSDRYRCEWQGG